VRFFVASISLAGRLAGEPRLISIIAKDSSADANPKLRLPQIITLLETPWKITAMET